jgi:hypothetical protein
VNAVLSELPAEHRPIAEKVLRGGLQSVRQAIDEQNKALEADGKPAIKAATCCLACAPPNGTTELKRRWPVSTKSICAIFVRWWPPLPTAPATRPLATWRGNCAKG